MMEVRLSYKAVLFCLFLLMFYSCSDGMIEEASVNCEGKFTVEASIGSSTRTALNGLRVVWQRDDAIGIFGSDDYEPLYFGISSGDGESVATFSGNGPVTSGMAKYPYAVTDRFEDGCVKTSVYHQQNYVESSFDSAAALMAAVVVPGEQLVFKNLCSVIKLSITGDNYVLKSIVIEPNSSDINMSGDAEISLRSGVPVMTMANKNDVSYSRDDGSISLLCEGVTLKMFDATDFYMVVPSQLYEGGISMTVTSSSGSVTKTTTADIDLRAGGMYTVPVFEMTLFGGITPSSSLAGDGTRRSPFQISSVADLLCLQDAMNKVHNICSATSGKIVFPNKAWYALSADLDLSVCCGPEIGSWMPIGPNENRFQGHFDGCGHSVTGLYIRNDAIEGGLFGDLYSGGYIGNLDVSGEVCCNQASILCKDNCGTVENCISRGTVYSTQYAGGLLSSTDGCVRYCKNYADVTISGSSYNRAGGICGFESSVRDDGVSYCVNYGNISSEGGNGVAGGIAGHCSQYTSDYGVMRHIINCSNYGNVAGNSAAGGIVGDMYHSGVANCVNYADVKINLPSGMGGGICGQIIRFKYTCYIDNCVNLGNITGNGMMAGICAENIHEVSYCYWLYDQGVGVSAGVFGGSSVGNTSLTVNQMKGNDAAPSLYGGYTSVIDALNAWAFTNTSPGRQYFGWMYDSQSGWPALSGFPATPPGGKSDFITVSPGSCELNTMAQAVEVQIVSSSDVSMQKSPSWVSSDSFTRELVGDTRYYTYSLKITKNESGDQREGSVVFISEDGKSATFTITQRYTYYSDDYSRDGNIVTLQKHTEGSGIDLVFMGDGYPDHDISSGAYEKDIKSGVDAFFSVEPYTSFRNMFNVYYVELVSQTDSFTDDRETALECYFGNGTLVGGNDSRVIDICKKVTGKSDLSDVTAIVMVNARRYAGTCYMYHHHSGDHGLGMTISYFGMGTSSSGQTSMASTLRHEACGHGFGKLADEYSYSSCGAIPEAEINSYRELQTYGWWPNVDFTSDPFSVRWSKFIVDQMYDKEQIGVFEGAATYWMGAYRPTQNSIMRYNTGKFNAPSRESIYYKIHRLAYGSGWQYDYDAFLEYDSINRTSPSGTVSSSFSPEQYQPLHPPVVVGELP